MCRVRAAVAHLRERASRADAASVAVCAARSRRRLCLERILQGEDTRTLEQILVQDCGKRPDVRHLKKPDASSKYRASASFDKSSQAWRPFLYVDREKQHFGYYDTEKQAAKAHDWCVSDTPCALHVGRAS